MSETNRQEQEAALAAEWHQWNQKKRPATPMLRAELLSLARKLRSQPFIHPDGSSLTAGDWRRVRTIQRERYRKTRAAFLAADAEEERSFWAFLKKFGISTEGGIQ